MQDSITKVVETRTSELQREAVRLRGQREAIDDRLTEIDGELGELEIAVRVYRRFESNGVAPTLDLDLDTSATITRDVPSRLPDVSALSLADAVATVLRVYGNDAPSRDLRHILIDAGKLPPGRNSYGYLLKILRDKSDRFVKDPTKGTWSLREGQT